MQVYTDINKLPTFKNAVLTLGTFDGVHLGHQQIINDLISEAKKINGESLLISFDPHPRKIVNTKHENIRIINTIDEKIELLTALGVEHLVLIPFTEEFAKQTGEEFIKNFLLKYFRPHIIIIGYDHKFGVDRTGDYHLLEKMGKEFDFNVKEISKHVMDEIAVSSTKIRNAILQGDMQTANKLLGYTFFMQGRVIEGKKLGRKIGYPTANLRIEKNEKIIPTNGVYAVECCLKSNAGISYKGMMNIGFKPTVGSNPLSLEVNLFDFDENINGELLKVFVKKRIRDEQKFPSIEALKKQLAKDRRKCE